MAENYWNVPKNPYQSYPGTEYTKLPEYDAKKYNKREHLSYIIRELESGKKKQKKMDFPLEGPYGKRRKYETGWDLIGDDWKMQDDILQNYNRALEAQDLFTESGARWVGNEVDEMMVNTDEKTDMLDRSMAIFENLAAIQGGIPFKKARREGDVVDPEHWLPKGIETLRGWEDKATDWLRYQTKYNIPSMWKDADMSGILSEIPKLIPNAITGTPEWAKDWATLLPRLIGEYYWPEGDEPDLMGELFQGFDTSNIIPYDEEQVNKHVMEGIEFIPESLLAGKGFKELYNRSPEGVRTFLRNFYPSARNLTTSFGSDLQNYIRKHGIKMDAMKDWMKPEGSTYRGKIKSIKPKLSWGTKAANLAKAPWKYWRGPAQLALGTGTAAGLGTLLHSGPAYGALDDEAGMNYRGSYADQIRDNIDFPAPSPSLIQDSDPVIFDDYVSERLREPRDERRGPGPWNEFRG